MPQRDLKKYLKRKNKSFNPNNNDEEKSQSINEAQNGSQSY